MKHHRGDAYVILPTDEVVAEYRPSELLLQQIGLDLRSVATAVVDHWVQSERHWGNPTHPALLTMHDVMFNAIYPDLWGQGDIIQLDRDDRRAIERLLKEYCAEIYLAVIPLLESFKFTEAQLDQLAIAWLADSMVIRISY